jgi:hypothetical protein
MPVPSRTQTGQNEPAPVTAQIAMFALRAHG